MVAAGVALIGACYGFARFAYGLFSPELQREFDLSGAWSGVIGAGSYVGYCVAIVWSSAVTPRWGARRVAVLAGAVATGGLLVVATAPSAVILAVGLLVAGSSTGIASPPLAAAISQWVRRPAEDRAQTLVNAGTGVGVLVSGPIALALMAQWRWAWAAYAVGAAAITWWIHAAVPPDTPSPDADRSRTGGHDAVLLTASLLLGVGSIAVWTFGREIVTAGGGTSAVVGALMWTVIGAAGILGAASGPLVQRLGIRRSWALLMVALAAATGALAVAPGSIAIAVIAAATFGAAYIALTGVALLWATRRYPGRTAYGVGASFLLIAVGQAVGAPTVGLAADALGLPAAFYGCAAIALVGAAVPGLSVPSARMKA